jgi:integrase
MPRFLSRSEAHEILERVPDPEIADLIRFAIGSGLRRGELVALRLADVDESRGTIHVHAAVAKGRSDRLVPLSSWAREAYRSRLAAGCKGRLFTLTADKATHRVRRACHEAGFPWCHLHSLRHTFASWLRIGGAPIDRIQYWLGHTDIKTTMVYAHITPHLISGELETAFSASVVGPLLAEPDRP